MPDEKEQPDIPERIADTHRNGSRTAIGIVLGFSLTFLSTWSQSPGEWKTEGIPVILLLLAGIAVQFTSLYRLSLDLYRWWPSV